MKQSKGDGVRGRDGTEKAPWAGGRHVPSVAVWSLRPRQRAAQGRGAGALRPAPVRPRLSAGRLPAGGPESRGTCLVAIHCLSSPGPLEAGMAGGERGTHSPASARRAPRPGSRKPRWLRAGGASAGGAEPPGPAGAALSRRALSLFQVGVPQINSLVPLKKRKKE